MTRLIGSRWKRREACSRGVLIRPVSRAEFCIARLLMTLIITKMHIRTDTSSVRFWWFGGGDTPDPIPNSAVKPASGDGTHCYRWGE